MRRTLMRIILLGTLVVALVGVQAAHLYQHDGQVHGACPICTQVDQPGLTPVLAMDTPDLADGVLEVAGPACLVPPSTHRKRVLGPRAPPAHDV